MITAKFIVDDKLTPSTKKKRKELAQLPQDTYTYFRAHTPIRTGNARKNTRFANDTIIANYPYAQRLDQGYSKQAPDGMSRPTEAYFKKRLDAIFGKK